MAPGAVEHHLNEPLDLNIDDGRPAAGGIVVLTQVFAQHATAELRFVPGNFEFPGPRLGRRTIDDACNVHLAHDSLRAGAAVGIVSRLFLPLFNQGKRQIGG